MPDSARTADGFAHPNDADAAKATPIKTIAYTTALYHGPGRVRTRSVPRERAPVVTADGLIKQSCMAIDYTRARLLLEPSEGNVSHMYLDTKGFVTVGIGNMLPSASAAQALSFVNRTTGNAATAAEIAADFASVAAQPPAQRARVYRQVTKLDCRTSKSTIFFDAASTSS